MLHEVTHPDLATVTIYICLQNGIGSALPWIGREESGNKIAPIIC